MKRNASAPAFDAELEHQPVYVAPPEKSFDLYVSTASPAFGITLVDGLGKVRWELGDIVPESQSPPLALEHKALIAGLEAAYAYGAESLAIHRCSAELVGCFKPRGTPKEEPFRSLHKQAKALWHQIPSVKFSETASHSVSLADAICNQALTSNTKVVPLGPLPSFPALGLQPTSGTLNSLEPSDCATLHIHAVSQEGVISGHGIVIQDAGGKIRYECGEFWKDRDSYSQQVEEQRALAIGISKAINLGIRSLVIRITSVEALKLFRLPYFRFAAAGRYWEVCERIKELQGTGCEVRIELIPASDNSHAERLANHTVETQTRFEPIKVERPPENFLKTSAAFLRTLQSRTNTEAG